MIVREAKIDDFAAICEICTNDLGYQCDERLVKRRLENLDESREIVYISEIGGEVTGFVHAEIYITLYFETMVNILGLAVAEKHRRKGCGRALMTEVEDWALTRGIEFARLNSGTARESAHKFYRNIGYDREKGQIRFMKKLK